VKQLRRSKLSRPSTFRKLDNESKRYAAALEWAARSLREEVAQGYRDGYRTALGDLVNAGLVTYDAVKKLSPVRDANA
jgi:hypothetical protein